MAFLKKVNPIPKGLHTIIPHLTVNDASSAIEFYKRAFGAEEREKYFGPDGKSIIHASLQIGDSRLYLMDESLAMGGRSARTLGGTPIMISLNVVDADKVFERALAAGAKSKMPLADMFWGDRYGVFTDPFGFEWSVSTRIRDLTPEEIRKAAHEAIEKMRAEKK